MDNMSILAAFDDLRRCVEVLIDGTAEEEFLKYVKLQDENRLKWLGAIQEAHRLQRELDISLQNMADLETKLFHARKFVEIERKARKEAEYERDQMEKKIMAVADILGKDNQLNEHTREQIAFLNTYAKKRKSHGDDKLGNDINSTGSFLSDLSLTTQSEDDFLDLKNSRHWKRHRPSGQKTTVQLNEHQKQQKNIDGEKTRRSSKYKEIEAADKIVAQTTVSIPTTGDGPIRAESIIEAVPHKPDENYNKENELQNRNDMKSPPRKSPKRSFFTPSAPPLHEFNSKMTPNRSVMRSHNFGEKTFIRPDTCINCQKKIRFGTTALKCQSCRICVHPYCKEFLKVTCAPQCENAPGFLASISDFAPSISPKIPALIVHCVNEVETRGLNEVGIYRVSGSEREIKQLKERFLRGKSTPNISNIDVHVLCGCIKDFLRSLKEPLIPTNLWKDFSNAVQNMTEEDIKNSLFKAIDNLPEANRDTLAFLILHFQRVAQCVEVKMPIENIARVFGPTIVGYSSLEPSEHAILTETRIQFTVMETLMHIPTDYWTQFIRIEYDDVQKTPRMDDFKQTYESTMKKFSRKERKFYGTPPYPTSARK